MTSPKKKWKQRLKDSGFRLTAGRELVISVLKNTKKHLSAEDIYVSLHKTYPEIGLTTIYRTLDILAQVGIAEKFDFGDGRARYELAEDFGSKNHHHHLVCKKCKKIIDYTDFISDEISLLKKTEKGLSGKYNFIIEGHLIKFFGLCSKCK